MVTKRQVLKNAAMSVVQVAVNGGISFVLYAYLLRSLGPEQLGIWSLVLATTSVTNVANLGFSASVVKFVAKYRARGEPAVVSQVITTASVSISAFIGLVVLAAYPVLKPILGMVVGPAHFQAALSVLPYSLISLWVMSVAFVVQSGLDGAQRIDLRNYLAMSAAGLYLVLCLVFVPRYGLKGVAYGQVAQSIILLILSWLTLRRIVPGLPVLPIRWKKSVFKEIVGYGVNFQIISVTAVLYDPITKAYLSRFGGLSLVGYYEMASRMVQQFRALIVSANQVLVPAIAELHEKTPRKIREIYLASYRWLFYLAWPLYSLIIVGLPAISRVWIGRYETAFIIFGTVLVVGWFLNTLNVPSYFVYSGTGELRWNVASHLAVGALNAGLGFFLGRLFGGLGVVLGWIAALAVGSSLIYFSYHFKNGIPLKELIPESSRPILVTGFIGALSALLVFFEFNRRRQLALVDAATILSFCLIMAFFLWLHPLRQQLAGWAKAIFSGNRLGLDSPAE